MAVRARGAVTERSNEAAAGRAMVALWAFQQAADEPIDARGQDCACGLCTELWHWSCVLDPLVDLIDGDLNAVHQLARHYMKLTGGPPPGRWTHEQLDLLDKIAK
jgi:hypothetical protein